MAAVGDSMTRAFNLCEGISDCPEESWATGTRTDSHYARLRGLGASLTAHNLAVSGSTVSSLEDQARRAVATGAGYVTVLIGTNDACTGREESMTPVAAYAAAFERGLGTLMRGLPGARVLVVSVPDLMRLWEVGKDVPAVRERWETIRVCQSMLADPLSNDADDVARRARVRARVEAYNAVMARACARYTTCRWDGGAVFRHRFGLGAVSERDGWHPSREGQRLLADLTWRAGWWR
jgi:lysophospholipase L1-like esterase